MEKELEIEYLKEYAGIESNEDIEDYYQQQKQDYYEYLQEKKRFSSILDRMADGVNTKYKNWLDVKKDLVNIIRTDNAVKRLVTFLLPNLRCIVNYPIYKSKKRYKYESLDQVNDVENCLLFGLYKVAQRVRIEDEDKRYAEYFKKIDIEKKDINSIMNILAAMIRNAATEDIYEMLDVSRSKNKKKVIYMDNNILAETINITNLESTVEERVIKNEEEQKKAKTEKELKKVINNAIDNFLKNKDKLDTTIFLNHIIADAKYGKYAVEKLTQERIATINKVDVRTVRRREKKLLSEFQRIWKLEVEPLLTE